MAIPTSNPFIEAKKEQAKLRMAIMGASGSGKTWTSLLIAEQLAKLDDGKIAFLDTEGRSARKYADRFTFDVYDLSKDYSPNRYIDGILAAATFGYSVIVIDSFSHAWNGVGGVLDIVDKAGKNMGGNDWAGWSKGRPAQNNLVDTLINADIHIIGTMRARTDWVLELNEKTGKTKPVKKGLAPVQSSEFEYEFDIVIQMSMEHKLTVSKSRCTEIEIGEEYQDAPQMGIIIHNWLSDGESKSLDIDAIQKVITWAKERGYGDNEPELLSLLGEKDWTFTNGNGRKACKAIEAAHNTLLEELNEQNANDDETPEPVNGVSDDNNTSGNEPETLSDEDKLLISDWLKLNFNLTLDEATVKLPDGDMSRFATAQSAQDYILEQAKKSLWPVITKNCKYIANGKYILFSTLLGGMRAYGRTKFAELVGDKYANDNAIALLGDKAETIEPLLLTGEQKKGYILVTKAEPLN